MKEISFSLFHLRAVSVGDFLIGRTSIRPHTPIGADGRRTARRGALAGGCWRSGSPGISRQRRAGSGAWRAFLRRGFNSSGGIMRSIKGRDSPHFQWLPATDGQRGCPWWAFFSARIPRQRERFRLLCCIKQEPAGMPGEHDKHDSGQPAASSGTNESH